jgi:biopolymer transport protein ExbD
VKRRRSTKGPDSIVDPNMTPLIDVSLVLVVILMVATPLAFQSSISVQTAAPAGQSAPVPTRAERIELEVMADGGVRVNQFVVPRAALAQTLKPLLDESASRTVVVRCADGVSHGAFVGVLDEARALGAARIAVVGG